MKTIAITGSEGLIGQALVSALQSHGYQLRRFDLRLPVGHPGRGNVLDAGAVARLVADCDGVIHLAAVSRVIWGERDPELCWATNVDGLRNVLDAAHRQPRRPWVIFASSREVYGQPSVLPASEETPREPVNIYGRSKVMGEQLMEAARLDGLRASVIRLSNVYGSTADHADRVVPAFARAAVLGRSLRVEGADHTFDFTHISDVAQGIVALVSCLNEGQSTPPPIHFLTGEPTTLGQLAQMAIEAAESRATVEFVSPRSFDVARFYGTPARAKEILGWSARVSLRVGLTQLIHDFRRELGAAREEGNAP